MSSFLLVTTADIIWSPDTDVLVLSAVCKKNGIYIWFKTGLYKECDRFNLYLTKAIYKGCYLVSLSKLTICFDMYFLKTVFKSRDINIF